MKLILVTGLSGAGKTQALRVLEDIGVYCVDNLPPIMIPQFIKTCAQNHQITMAAIGVDTRGGTFFTGIDGALLWLDQNDTDVDILYLDASDSVLINRFKETRRTHPLEKTMPIDQAIAKERQVLAPLHARATRVIDTSAMLTRELRQLILSMYRSGENRRGVVLNVLSFGYKNGLPPEADVVFDVRFLPNPYYVPELKELTGRDAPVYDYVMSFAETQRFMSKLEELMTFLLPFYLREGSKYPTVAFGCTGGQHRSVSVARAFAQILAQKNINTEVRHRDLHDR